MGERLIRLETFINELDAEIARGRLTALGVQVVLQKDNCGGMRPHLDLQQGVRLLVTPEDLEKAQAILKTPADPGTASPAWTCPECSEAIEAGFDACWQCGYQAT